MADARLKIIVDAQDNASRGLAGISRGLEGLGGVAKNLALGGLALAGGAAVGLGYALNESLQAAMEAEKVQAQLNAVLKSTGGVAGVTAEMANEYATALSQVTMFEDDAILSGENLLLTFTNIGKDIFPQATEMTLDMSQALGQDLKSSALQLGKALNDPTKGLTALTRVGVSFTEQQKKEIVALQKSGDLLGAQKIILQELQREFGGAAQAAGDTLPGKLAILQNTLGNIKESVGGALIGPLTDLLDKLTPKIQEFAGHLGTLVGVLGDKGWSSPEALKELQGMFGDEWGLRIQNAGKWLGETATALGNVGSAITTYGLNSPEAFAALTTLMGSEESAQGLIDTLNGISGALSDIGEAWNGVKGFFEEIDGFIKRINEWSVNRGGKPLVGGDAPFFGGIDADTAIDDWHRASQAQKEMEQGAAPARSAISQVGDALGQAFGNASSLGEGLTNLGAILEGQFSNPFGTLAGTLNAAADAGARLLGLLEQIKSFMGAGGAPMFGAGGGSTGFGGAQASGSVWAPGGMTMVGERGPELVLLPGGSRVYNADETARREGRSGTTNNITINVTGGNSREVEMSVLRALRSAGVS